MEYLLRFVPFGLILWFDLLWHRVCPACNRSRAEGCDEDCLG